MEPESAEKAVSAHEEITCANYRSNDDAVPSKPEGTIDFSERVEMKQGLQSRHIQMIALAGAIGTGLFLNSGRAVASAGPLGALLGYAFVGTLVAGMVFSMAEMAALAPLSGGIVRFAELFVDPSLSFANGWNVVYKGLIFVPTEVVAAAVLMEFWIQVNSAIWITVFGIVMVVANFMFVGVYGEIEFWFAMLKIFLILMVNVMAIVIVSGGGPNGQAIGFRYWQDPGPMVQYLGIGGSLGRFLGFWSVFTNAVYAYSGIDNVALAAAETANARATIPKAAKKTFWRILIFYIVTMFFVGMLVPSNNKHLVSGSGSAASPFVIAADLAGIKVIPHIINGIVVTSAWSAGNAGYMVYSRYLFGLAKSGHAPKVFLRLNRWGIPYVAAILVGASILLGYMTTSNSAAEVFSWLQGLLSIAILVNWTVVIIVYLRFFYGCKKQGISRDELPYKSPFQPYFSWICLVVFVLILITSGWSAFLKNRWSTKAFVSAYANIPVVLILYFAHKQIMKTKVIPLDKIPIRQLLDIANNELVLPDKPKKGLRKLNFLW